MFTERLKKRKLLWWGSTGSWYTPNGLLLRLHRRGLKHFHRGDELQIMRRQTDSDSEWKFCRYWQRTLINKWNSREFSQKHHCKVPELYWYGQNLKEMPIESFPDNYVIRPVWGTARKGIYVMSGNLDLLTNTSFEKTQLKEHLISQLGEVSKCPILVEEFVRSEQGEYKLPIEYKFYMFGEKIAFISVHERISYKSVKFSQQFTSDWQQLTEPIDNFVPLNSNFEQPQCYQEMVSCVKRLGVAFGTFIRVDYYATDKGAIFSEFSSIPHSLLQSITPFGDQYLGKMWHDIYPNKI
ncbi:MAG: ATP-grasp fold amidoligase family protein [Microcystaceae cyanobacterium]